MSPVQSLEPAQRAALQLLVQQGQSYDEIAGLLGLSPDAVRSRAHAALDSLGPEARRLDAEQRGEISDYLLGQQGVSEREATRKLLGESAGARAWARAVAGELRPLAKDDLPEIPDAADTPVEDDDAAPGEPAPEPLKDDATVKTAGAQRSSRLGGALLLVGLGILVAVVVVLLVTGSDGDDEPTASTQATGTTQTAQTGTQGQPQPIAQVNLRATEAGGKAVGVAQILRQGNQDALAIVAQKLKPNTNKNAYAVWLYNSDSSARLLGFVDPPVGKDGQFSNFQALPKDARKFKEVVVSRETQEAKRPETIILRGPLRLKGT